MGCPAQPEPPRFLFTAPGLVNFRWWIMIDTKVDLIGVAVKLFTQKKKKKLVCIYLLPWDHDA